MSRCLEPAEPPSALTIPKELWYPTPVHTNVLPATKPRLPMLVRLLPVIALVSGYTSELASTAHADASTLLLLAFAALVGLGWGAVRYAVRLGAPPPIGHGAMTGVIAATDVLMASRVGPFQGPT
jgi:hypothetical protein